MLPAHSTRLLEVSPQNAHPGRGSSRAALPTRFFSPRRLIKDHRAAASSQPSCTGTFLFGVSLPACLHCGGSNRASSQVTPCYQNNPARLTRSSESSLQLLSEQSSLNLSSKRSVLCCPTGLSCPRLSFLGGHSTLGAQTCPPALQQTVGDAETPSSDSPQLVKGAAPGGVLLGRTKAARARLLSSSPASFPRGLGGAESRGQLCFDGNTSPCECPSCLLNK